MAFDIDARLADWRNALLDTTKRNRLIKFVAGRTGGVNLVHPPAPELWSRLVVEGGRLTFAWKRELLGLPREILDAETLASDFHPAQGSVELQPDSVAQELTTLCLRSQNLKPSHLLTDFADRQLDARLIRLSRNAKEAETDHGVTTLFAAFGFLRWFDQPEATEEVLSPLLLVPVRLERESVEAPFTLRASEEDVLANHCLAELMANEFKIKLPSSTEVPLDADNAGCFAAYVQAVQERIRPFPRWSVVETAAIGVFNFQKLAMWEDLGRNAGRIQLHPLCRLIAGDAAAHRPPPANLPAANDLDRLVPIEASTHILDADSSQHEAIEAVKAGADVVIDGPPGTGKSQTIANIIAETLHAGKTVLFVSAKIAALEVVKRRLDQCGLGDFCLELYSHKASKKEVVAELGRCLDLKPTGAPDMAPLFAELGASRAQLNDFVRELHEVRQPLGWSAYRVHGELARIEGAWQAEQGGKVGRSRLAIFDPLSKGQEYVHTGSEILAGLRDCRSVIDSPNGHPWRGCLIANATHSIRADIEHLLREFASAIPSAIQATQRFAEVDFARSPFTVKSWAVCENDARCVLAAPLFPREWFRSEPRATARAVIDLDRATRDARGRLAELPEFDRAALWSVADLQRVTPNWSQERFVLGANLSARERLATLVRLRASLHTLRAQASAIDSLLGEAARQLRLGCALPFSERSELAAIARRIADARAIPPSWWDSVRRAELQAVVNRASEDDRAALAQRPALAALFAPIALQPESSPLAREAAEAAQSFWRWLPWSHWARLRKSVQAWYPTGAPGNANVRSDVAELGLYHRRMDATWQVAAGYASELLHDASGWVDWNGTAAALKDIDRLIQWGAAPDLKTLLGPGGGFDPSQLRAVAEKLAAAIQAFDAGFAALVSVLVVADPAARLAKPPSEVTVWLESELREIERSCEVLECVVGLLRPEKDVSGTALSERLCCLSALIAARGRAQQAAGVLQETRAPEALEAIDHVAEASNAQVLLELLNGWEKPLTPGRIAAMTEQPARERLDAIAKSSVAVRPQFEKSWNRITTELFPPNVLVSTNIVLAETPLDRLQQWAADRAGDIERLQEWTRFLQIEKDAATFGVSTVIEEVRAGEYGPLVAADAFRCRFYRLWLDALEQRVASLGQFSGSKHERLIARFTELDRAAIRSAPALVRNRLLLHPERPQTLDGAPESSELGILLREVHKKQRHLPLRRLFAQAPWVLPRIKPCLMMSPLAVSTYLESLELTFDLVIFDEASQVRPHDAICAIYRSRQLVVGGDPQQLPPTDFFNRAEDGDDEAANAPGSAGYESLLDVCLSRGLLRKWLRWHYRSRREGLIAFSNRHFYENRLITFPSAEETASRAVAFVKVADGRFQDGVNAIEARRVAQLVMEHARTKPELSLGVIAFSQRQQERILSELEIQRRQQPTCERFFAEDGAEPFFVKNLENVQGDERDVVVLSVGYGPDESGKVQLRFGPLNEQGGERRLNVAVTRARRGMMVVASMAAADIDVARAKSQGAKLLRAFLDYAEHGILATPEASAAGGDCEASPLEQAVADELARRGVAVQRSLGWGSYRIDAAVADGTPGGKFLLGVECDGATYRSAATARDRDRLRRTVLEGLGWRLLRVWSSDWAHDRDKQVQRILAAIEDARQGKSIPPALAVELPTASVSPPQTAKSVEYEDIDQVPASAVVEVVRQTLVGYGSMPADELAVAVSKRLGFRRTGAKIRDRIIAAVNEQVADGRLRVSDDGRVRLAMKLT
jgi:very-short-patch-repair endonuclease